MDRVIELTSTVRDVVKSYVNDAIGGRMYFAENPEVPLYGVFVIPDEKYWTSRASILAFIENGIVKIQVDNTDRYLYRLLIQAGVPRDKIIRAYLGETVPLSQIPVD